MSVRLSVGASRSYINTFTCVILGPQMCYIYFEDLGLKARVAHTGKLVFNNSKLPSSVPQGLTFFQFRFEQRTLITWDMIIWATVVRWPQIRECILLSSLGPLFTRHRSMQLISEWLTDNDVIIAPDNDCLQCPAHTNMSQDDPQLILIQQFSPAPSNLVWIVSPIDKMFLLHKILIEPSLGSVEN